MLTMPSSAKGKEHTLPPAERGKLAQHLLRFWNRGELESARTTAGMRRFFEDES
jgi:hypothetical protein